MNWLGLTFWIMRTARILFERGGSRLKIWQRYANIDMEEEEGLLELAKSFHLLGLKRFDALHLACAIKSHADYFLTIDSGILNKSGVVGDIRINDPIDFIREVFP